jgi:hypothetical protein
MIYLKYLLCINNNFSVDWVLNFLFFAEMLLKLYGLGVRKYLSKKINIYDGIITIFSMIQWLLCKLYNYLIIS